MAGSIEEKVEDHFKAELNRLSIKYYTKTDSINSAIDSALKQAESKSGGAGANFPDIKVLLQGERDIPVMIEAKGAKDKLIRVKDGKIELIGKDGKRAAITNYAVNGAIHYVNAILDEGTYKEGIAIGVNGYETQAGAVYELKAFYVSAELAREPKELPYSDLSFLASPEKLIPVLKSIDLTEEEREKLIQQKRDQFDKIINDIHQEIYEDQQLKTRLGTNDKLMFFSGLIFAGLGGKGLPAFTCDDLKGAKTSRNDGALIIERIREILENRHSKSDKIEMILADLSKVFKNQELYTPHNGESLIKKYFKKIIDNVIPILSLRLNADFTGIILSKMKDWLDLDNDKKNDVVLTPSYITSFMARLCKTDMNSLVWDTAMGSGGFLISAMEIMIEDAKKRLPSPHEQEAKIKHIKENQLLGIEILSNIYILAVINMILTGDGSSKIQQGDSFKYLEGSDSFPYNVFLLNPPYSAAGKGLSFVDEALKRMANGYGAVLIQENAGSGNGQPYAANILKHSSLVASIHMADIFKGRSGVQTAIYLFKANEPHDPKSLVTFVDFSEDGYSRQNRRKSSEAVNLRDTDHAQERYAEVEAIVLNKRKETNYYSEENGTVIKDTITLEGSDWTFAQHKKVDTTPTEADFKQTVKDYLAWKVSQIIQNSGEGLGKP